MRAGMAENVLAFGIGKSEQLALVPLCKRCCKRDRLAVQRSGNDLAGNKLCFLSRVVYCYTVSTGN